MPIRDAVAADLPAIHAIYAHHVLHGTGSFEEVPPSPAEMAARMAKIQGRGWPYFVEEADDMVRGFAYLTQYRDRSAYRCAAEDSVYVRDDIRGQGVGKSLVQTLLDRAGACGFRQVIAVIGDSENIGSVGLHASLGFRQVGVLKAAGIKFDRWLDVVLMQRPVGDGDRTQPG
jgi:L-amino acid N-acyltransferase YncA